MSCGRSVVHPREPARSYRTFPTIGDVDARKITARRTLLRCCYTYMYLARYIHMYAATAAACLLPCLLPRLLPTCCT